MIVVKISDGLGNQLFQYAYARVLQTKIKHSIYLDISDINRLERVGTNPEMQYYDTRKYQLDNLSITLPIISKDKISKIYKRNAYTCKFLRYCDELQLLPTVFLNEALSRESSFHFSKWQNYYIEGYFFDKKYYEKEIQLLMQEFRLKKKLVLSDEIQKILADRNTVSIHIRRGDFLRIGRDISKNNYYEKAMKNIKDRIYTPFLLVFSDDITWVQDNMKFDLDYLYISGQGFSDCEELTLMSMCKNNIIANSTFSYWGALLNPNKEKIVISPRGWRQKIIPDTWIQL